MYMQYFAFTMRHRSIIITLVNKQQIFTKVISLK